MNSILNSIKKLLNITEEQTNFDNEIIIHINSVFSDLNQIGLGPNEGFAIVDETSVWSDFVADTNKLNNVIQYVYLRVKLVFDPPSNSSVVSAMERMADKLEWRLNVASELISTELEET